MGSLRGKQRSGPEATDHRLGARAGTRRTRSPRPPGRLPLRLLLRKEVIQPHLPIRLPCYDFIPVTSFTFGASLPCGLGQRLRVLPASVM